MKTEIKQLIENLKNRILDHQMDNGFETIFDFINEDLDNIINTLAESEQPESEEKKCSHRETEKGCIKNCLTDDCKYHPNNN